MLAHLVTGLRLHGRNKLALLYSYLFPTLFLLAFWVLYRYDQVPLVRHLGELLTVTVLGGACFGLPTTLVSERERGVWRRYRLAPVPTGALLASTLVARYLLLLLAGLLQVALAFGLGMPLPRHPFDLLLAFTAVAIAFLGLGLVIAMLANTVPAVQALGQCLFLPLLIVGGIAVPLARLPPWAQDVAAFFPGRYAVAAIDAAVLGPGLAAAGFSVLALLTIGVAAGLAGTQLFRWDPQQRVPVGPGTAWVAVALAAWVSVGLAAHRRDDRGRPTPALTVATTDPAPPAGAPPPPTTTPVPQDPPRPAPVVAVPDTRVPPPSPPATDRPAAPAPAVDSPPAKPPAVALPPMPASWRAVTMEQIDRDLRFDRLPPDGGVVSPIAAPDEDPDTDLANHLDFIASALTQWKPAQVADPVQRVRNVLFVAAVPDVFQMEPLERFIPRVVFEHLRQNVPKEDLARILYWIALHPAQGDDSAVDDLRVFRLGNGPSDIEQTRERVALYAVKLLGRLLGKIP
jgi:ABC-2 type transport system permease protein